MNKIIRHQHIPKTGSTSTKHFYKDSIVYGYEQNQLTLNADIPEDAVSFTILRDPLDRFKSNIKYFIMRTSLDQDNIINIIFNKTFTPLENTKALESHRLNQYPEEYIVFHSMSIFDPFLNVFDADKNLKAKHLINFNNMTNELQQLLPEFDYNNYPNSNKSNASINLTTEQLEQYEHHFKEDILFYKQTGFSKK
jgi:hypothetical protein